jgi:hypothetical protein
LKKTIVVYSDDPETPQLVLTLSGELWVDVAAQPNRLSFGELRTGKPVSKPLSLTVTKPDEVRITGVTAQDERLAIKPLPSGPQGQQNYEVSFQGSAELGRIQGGVRVVYAGPNGDEHLDVPVWGQVVGDLRYPKRVFLRKQGDAYLPQKVTLSSRSERVVRILGAKDPDGRLEVKILKPQGPQVELELSIHKTDKPVESAQGNIVVTTNDRQEPKVTLPYSLGPPKFDPVRRKLPNLLRR